jgi:hypothetical protein
MSRWGKEAAMVRKGRATVKDLYNPSPDGVYVWPLDDSMRVFGRAWLAGRSRRQHWNEYARLCPDGRTFRSQEAYMIYALCEPETEEIRYIGITNNAPDRLKRHLHQDTAPLRHIWLSSLRELRQKPTMKCLALAYGPRCFAEQHERAWIRVLFAHGCDLLNQEALLGPCAYVFRVPFLTRPPYRSFCETGNIAVWEEQTALYLQDGIPVALPDDLRFYVYQELGDQTGYGRYTLAEYSTFRYEPAGREP